MALDFVIGLLIFISAIVNLLALGAFWVTPSLRTTSNRFIINLLTVNLVSNLILAPSLLLNATSSSKDKLISETTETHQIINATVITTKTIEKEEIYCSNFSKICNVNGTRLRIKNFTKTEKEVKDEVDTEKIIYNFEEIRTWGLDVAAALGSLSVLLVVGDTWCAITDPLRYHTRISSLRAWILIISTWIVGILFGLGSAFRTKRTITDYIQSKLTENKENTDETTSVINITTKQSIINPMTTAENIYATIYSTIFFLFAILIPFVLVCEMYWKIYSEARGNGLRMRQNGSSPLLQSALNLAANSTQYNNNSNNSNNNNSNSNNNNDVSVHQLTPGGLTLKIDRPSSNLNVNKNLSNNSINNNNSSTTNNSGNNNNRLVTLSPSLQRPLRPSKNRLEIPSSDNNQNNILLTITSETPVTPPEQIRRNHSAKQLFLLDNTSTSEVKADIRHTHSTPNLPKLIESEKSQNVLPMPSINVSPKALSYMTSIRHRLSNASSLFKYREESRAARISILVVIMFLISYLPYGALVLLHGHINIISPYHQAVFAILTILLANISSPFIFAYRNKRIVRGVKRLIRLERKTNDRFNRHQNTYKTTVAKVKRTCSKASTYSTNSNRYLTPHSALKGTFVLEIEKCTDDEDSSYEEKKSFLKRICDTSRKWDCTSDSCTGKLETEQTEV